VAPVPDLGVYVHFPWCRSLCPYCDFAVTVAKNGAIPHDAYRDAITAELAERAPAFAGRRLVSIYFGGGTPSLWPAAHLGAVVDDVCRRFAATPASLEITLEANPSDCVPETMAGWRAAGINRLSIGVQSFDGETLAVLGRDHRMGDGAIALAAARTAGFATLSADIIFGTPRAQRHGHRDVDAAVAAGVDHLSVYELTIEERTAFGRAARVGSLVPRDEDELAADYVAIHAVLEGRGFEHYEVSSYARPDRQAVHNSLYWRGAEYLGLGVGAASLWHAPDEGALRWKNLRSTKRYLAAAAAPRPAGDASSADSERRVEEHESLSADELATDRLWLGLRTRAGVALAALADRPRTVAWMLDAGLAESDGDRLRPTLRGFLHADAVAQRLVAEAPPK
jgi:putative oxygen-independent coproporphyrinogen III oxidase